MRYGWLLLVLVIGCTSERAVSKPDLGPSVLYGAVIEEMRAVGTEVSFKLEFTAVRGDVRYAVTIAEKDFVESEHKVEVRDGETFIDGRLALGTDGSMPTSQLTELTVLAGGKSIEVPRSLFEDCYNIWLGQGKGSDAGNLMGMAVRILDDGTLLISTPGSDAAGSYLVHWWIGGPHAPSRDVVTSEEELTDFLKNWRTKVPERR
jgi:hypothetical protein